MKRHGHYSCSSPKLHQIVRVSMLIFGFFFLSFLK
uniref:Uncharacterized protein n=1 Tax=Lepeophtheirus salmonis TaxID=72036 RepID=A0A0K2SZJ7_LEPSM